MYLPDHTFREFIRRVSSPNYSSLQKAATNKHFSPDKWMPNPYRTCLSWNAAHKTSVYSPLTKAMTMAHTKREGQILIAPRYPARKSMDFCSTRGTMNDRLRISFQITVANFYGKRTIFINQVVAMADRVRKLMMGTTKSARGMEQNGKPWKPNRKIGEKFQMTSKTGKPTGFCDCKQMQK